MTVDSDVRGDLAFAQGMNKAFHIEPLISTHGDPPFARPMTVNKIESCLTFGRAGRLRNIARYSKPVAILHQHVAVVAQPALLAVSIELGIGVGRAGMGFVRTL